MAQQDMHDDPQQLELLRVARIGRAQGLKGEVTVRLYTDDPEWRFEPDSVLYSRMARPSTSSRVRARSRIVGFSSLRASTTAMPPRP